MLTGKAGEDMLRVGEPSLKHTHHPASPVSEPAAFEEDVTATNCLDLTGFCTPEELKT